MRRAGQVSVIFDQALLGSSSSALQVYSAQRGGRRTHATPPTVESGRTLRFTPSAYAFQPGETVFSTVTKAAASSGGSLARARVVQFTAATGAASGTFLAGASSTVGGGYPIDVAVGDVDGDGDLDLLTANNSTSTVSVRLNGGDATGTGKGTFAGGSEVAVGQGSFGIVVGDVDGDGDLDLLTANSNSNTVSVRLNGGDNTGSNTGVFAGGTEVAVGYSPLSVAMGDVDGDGDLDLLTANVGDNTASVRLNGGDNTGSNTGVFAGGSEVAVGDSPYSVAVGDVDGDGDLDLLTANISSNTVSVRLNGGDMQGSNAGTFANGSEISTGSNPLSVAVGDVDGDGDLDLLTANYGGGSVSVRLNGSDATGSNPGTFANGAEVAVGDSPYSATLGDVDGDGDLDLLAATAGDGKVSVRLNGGDNSGSDTGAFARGADVAVSSAVVSLATGDVDGDGDLDLLAAQGDASAVSVRLNQPAVAPLPVVLTAFTAELAPGGAAVQLAWSTASEVNSARFDVERSTDGRLFAAINQVTAAGSSSVAHSYAHRDVALPSGVSTLYYRLRQVDFDGTSTYSPVRSVALAEAIGPLALFPNPARTATTLTGAVPGASVVVLDGLGRTIMATSADATGRVALSWPGTLTSGVYLVRTGARSLRLVVE